MKRNFTLSLFFVFVASATAQILSRSENWPNAGWSLTGSYTPAAVVFNPTTNSQFKYDASLAVPLGGAASIYIVSPFFSVKPSFDGGEKTLKINLNISFQSFANSVLFAEYWNADSSSWIKFGDAEAQTTGDYSTCSNVAVTLFIDIKAMTTNQLQNFRYRFGVVDLGNQLAGVCINSLVVSSFNFLPPSNLTVTNLSTSSATLNWVSNNGLSGQSSFQVEYGPAGFTFGTGIRFQNFSPAPIFGLNPGSTYAFFVREFIDDYLPTYSNWAGPKFFTTATLGLEEKELKGFKLYPNPIKDIVWMESEKTLNEISLYDLMGQELKNLKPNKSNVNIDLSSLSPGFYFIKVTTDNDTGIYKIIKN